MIPLSDNIPSRRAPVVNYAIIGICLMAFLAQLTSQSRGGRMVERFGMIPLRLTDPDAKPLIREQVRVRRPPELDMARELDVARGFEVVTIERELAPAAIPAWLTVVTCMFLHGGWMHFLGNMWFLYVFGDNVEDRFGHVGYALTYLGTGIAAAMAHYATNTMSVVPTIGASGAIAGVMGAYAWLYPDARVKAVLPLFVIIQIFILPAPVFLGIWFALQAFSGISASAAGQATGVAWWAHIGGFIAGAVVALICGRAHLGREAVATRRF